MILGWIMPSILDSRSIALEVLNELLFDGDSSRLHRVLVDQLEWANQVYGWVPSFYSDGLYSVQVEVRNEVKLDQVKMHIFQGIQKIANDGVDEAELNKAKTRLELELYRGMQTLQQKAYSLGFWQSVAGDYKCMFKRPEALRAVSIKDLKDVAQLLLDPHRQLSVYGLPSSSDSESNLKSECSEP
jgi:predicted Zn-dependent peptidase